MGERFGEPAEVVRWLGALQAQEVGEFRWSIAQRTSGCSEDDVEAALVRGEILRTHLLRPTWHVVTREDARWLLRLVAPRVHATNASRCRQLELDPAVLARASEVMAGAIEADGARTRNELGTTLRAAGIDPEGQRLPYLLMHAELEQAVISGPRRGRQHTYSLFDDRAGPDPGWSRDRSLSELARRYFVSRGPASARDFSVWSGLTLTDARAAVASLGDELEEEEGLYAVPGLGEAPERSGAFMLGMYDEMIMGYRELKVALAAPVPREGMLRRAIVIDGRTVGSWGRTLSARAVAVEATLFCDLDSSAVEALRAEADRFGAFLGLPVELTMTSAVP